MARGYFTDESMLRRVHRERALALAGPRALLMQATHPVAFAGFFANTTSLTEPYERLARTAFGRVDVAVHHDLLRIPYTHVFLCSSEPLQRDL